LRNKTLYILFLLSFLLTFSKGFSQLDSTILIVGFQTTVFYEDERNLLGINAPGHPIENLVFKSSQGDLDNVDNGIVNGFLSLTNLKRGSVKISVLQPVDTGLLLLNQKEFKVIKRPLTLEEKRVLELKIKPFLSLNGHQLDSLPIDAVRIATKFAINNPYKIVSIDVYSIAPFGYDPVFILGTLKSGNFDDYFKQKWSRLGVNYWVRLDNIKISDSKGKIYLLKSVSFKIIESSK
jgi:hypothetical protein